jgi:CheY-like chemotaxis protein
MESKLRATQSPRGAARWFARPESTPRVPENGRRDATACAAHAIDTGDLAGTRAAKASGTMAPRTDETRRIVLVDDEEALTWSLASRLGKARPQYIVDTACESESALALLEQGETDLLIADVRMPGMSGIDLILAAWKTDPDLPVIVMTAFKTPEVQRLAGKTAFLEKPFEFERFLDIVDGSLMRDRVGFSGAISVQTLPDIVQLYVLSNA